MIDNNTISKLAEKYGSPFFLLNENKIKENIELFRESFSKYRGKFTLGYSTKTNPQIGILKIMKKYDIISECASYLDLASSIEAGYSGEDTVYAGLHKPYETLEYAVDNNVKINDEKDIDELFFLGAFPDPDILIRTGGYKRLSNFIMYNLTYTELFFTETLWPDFSEKEFNLIINQYLNIDRKYGL